MTSCLQNQLSKDQLSTLSVFQISRTLRFFFTHLDTLYDAKMMFGCKVVESLDK